MSALLSEKDGKRYSPKACRKGNMKIAVLIERVSHIYGMSPYAMTCMTGMRAIALRKDVSIIITDSSALSSLVMSGEFNCMVDVKPLLRCGGAMRMG